MLALAVLYLATAVRLSVSHPTKQGVHRRGISITETEVDYLDLYSQYAAATYCNANTTAHEPIACEVNCDRVLSDGGTIIRSIHDESLDLAGYVAAVDSRRQIIFAARGTYTNINWITNLDFTAVPSNLAPGAKVHLGFQVAWDALADGVRQAIKEAVSLHPDYRIVALGHSLGGAIATLGAAHLRAEDGYDIDLYTYGQPRVGNAILSDFITNQPGRIYRVTHNADPVPRLPPAFILENLVDIGYRHTSPEVWLTGEPADPAHWPVELIKTCEGNYNLSCNSNHSIPYNAVDHGVYFGTMSCFKDASTNQTVSPAVLPISFQDRVNSLVQAKGNAPATV